MSQIIEVKDLMSQEEKEKFKAEFHSTEAWWANNNDDDHCSSSDFTRPFGQAVMASIQVFPNSFPPTIVEVHVGSNWNALCCVVRPRGTAALTVYVW